MQYLVYEKNNKKLADSVVLQGLTGTGYQTSLSAQIPGAYELSKEVDIMIVIGGKSSSNTTKLYQICSENCENTFHIENEKELDIDMLKELKHERIGLTAGASTPDWIIQNVTDTLKNNL